MRRGFIDQLRLGPRLLRRQFGISVAGTTRRPFRPESDLDTDDEGKATDNPHAAGFLLEAGDPRMRRARLDAGSRDPVAREALDPLAYLAGERGSNDREGPSLDPE